MAGKTTLIGNHGEDIAVKWLRKNGFLIVARNWRSGSYELDIVAQKGFTLHFIEVKTRHRSGWSRPEDAMTPNKCRAMLKAASIYTAMYPCKLELQLDLIAIEINGDGSAEVRYIAEAVQSRW